MAKRSPVARARVPKSFKLGSHTFQVKRCSPGVLEEMAGQEVYGLIIPDRLLICLVKDGPGISPSVVEQAFWHEFSHAMLWVAAHSDYGKESVIEQFGHLLKQATDSFVYPKRESV